MSIDEAIEIIEYFLENSSKWLFRDKHIQALKLALEALKVKRDVTN